MHQTPMISADDSPQADFFWFLPTSGDGRYLGTSAGARNPDFSYLTQVARAADDLGYEGALLPTGRSCEDSWIIASALAPLTERLKFLVAVRPGLQSPSVAARMTAALDRVSNGRLLINIVTGGDPIENKGDGLFLDHKDRYALTAEFLQVYSRLLAGETITFKGRYIEIEDGRLQYLPVQQPKPSLYFGGSSAAGIEIAARDVDTFLTWGEPPDLVAQKIADVKAAALKHNRTLRYGLRVHVIVRETSSAAWTAADKLIERLDDEAIAAAQSVFARMDSVGQKRMTALHGGRRDRLEIAPNLWAGVGLVRGGAGTALVGDPETVAERIREYIALGIDNFILSGYPHLEEAYRFAELVFPLLPIRRRKLKAEADANMGPFGETLKRAAAVSATLRQTASS